LALIVGTYNNHNLKILHIGGSMVLNGQ